MNEFIDVKSTCNKLNQEKVVINKTILNMILSSCQVKRFLKVLISILKEIYSIHRYYYKRDIDV